MQEEKTMNMLPYYEDFLFYHNIQEINIHFKKWPYNHEMGTSISLNFKLINRIGAVVLIFHQYLQIHFTVLSYTCIHCTFS